MGKRRRDPKNSTRISGPGKSEKRVNKAGDEFVLKSQSFIEPKLDIESMPHASKLPMVCVPVGWGRQEVEGVVGKKRVVPDLGELVGGYLNSGTSNMSLPFRLLTTKDSEHYYAVFTSINSSERLCNTLTQLQSIGFQIDTDVLAFLESNQS